MADEFLGDRKKALEESFFAKENAKLVERLRNRKLAEQAEQSLMQASGIRDTQILRKLVELGIEADTWAAISLVPLIEVAWADGNVDPKERRGAHWVRGMSALQAGNHAAAVEHLRQADHANNMFVRYHLALAEEGQGNTDVARQLFAEVGSFNFNSIGFALVGGDARERSSS